MADKIYLIASAIAILGAALPGFGIGKATGSAVEAVARQPEASGKIQSILLLGCALAESIAIYCLLVSLLLLFLGK